MIVRFSKAANVQMNLFLPLRNAEMVAAIDKTVSTTALNNV